MRPALNIPLLQVQKNNGFALVLYGGALVTSLYFAYLAWLKPDDYLDATSMGRLNIPVSESVRIYAGRFLFPASTALWIFLLYIALTS